MSIIVRVLFLLVVSISVIQSAPLMDNRTAIPICNDSNMSYTQTAKATASFDVVEALEVCCR